MTTSYVLTKTVGQVIDEGLRSARIIDAEQETSDIDYQNGLDALNLVIKRLQANGDHLWKLERAVLPLVASQKSYTLGPSGANCGKEGTFYRTTLGAAGAANDTVLTVASSSNMTAAPNILTSDPTDSTTSWTAGNSATLSTSSGLVVTNGAASAGYAEYSLDTTVGQTYVVRFSYTLGTSSSATFTVYNGTTAADTVTLSASATDQELTITAVNTTITFRAANVSTTSGETSTVYDLEYVDTETGSQIGIILDDGTRYWDYVLNVDSSTSIDLVTGLSGAAASGNEVLHYQEQIQKPLRLDNVMYSSSFTGSEIPVEDWSRQEYMEQPSKSSTGTVVGWYYSPDQLNGTLYVWQTANLATNVLRFDYREPLTVYDSVSDTLAIPEEYFDYLKWAIAAECGPEYGVSMERQAVLEGKAASFLELALGNDSESGSVSFEPDYA